MRCGLGLRSRAYTLHPEHRGQPRPLPGRHVRAACSAAGHILSCRHGKVGDSRPGAEPNIVHQPGWLPGVEVAYPCQGQVCLSGAPRRSTAPAQGLACASCGLRTAPLLHPRADQAPWCSLALCCACVSAIIFSQHALLVAQAAHARVRAPHGSFGPSIPAPALNGHAGSSQQAAHESLQGPYAQQQQQQPQHPATLPLRR